MKNFAIAVVVGLLAGSIGGYALLLALIDRRVERQIGDVEIGMNLPAEVFTRKELLIGLVLAAALAAVVTAITGALLGLQKRRRAR
jgi:hypothetical protein